MLHDRQGRFVKGSSNPKKNPQKVICIVCKKIFYVQFHRIKTAKYCSHKCRLSVFAKKGKMPVNIDMLKKGFSGKDNPKWKGNKVSYHGLHIWVTNHKGKPSFCECCKKTDRKTYEWANISRKYRRDLNDFIRLCKSCHTKYDRRRLSLRDIV